MNKIAYVNPELFVFSLNTNDIMTASGTTPPTVEPQPKTAAENGWIFI